MKNSCWILIKTRLKHEKIKPQWCLSKYYQKINQRILRRKPHSIPDEVTGGIPVQTALVKSWWKSWKNLRRNFTKNFWRSLLFKLLKGFEN